jgi:hypothetical protein
MVAVVDSVKCDACGGQHNLCTAPDNYSPEAVYEYICPRTNQPTRATPNKPCSPAATCPIRAVYAKRVEQ